MTSLHGICSNTLQRWHKYRWRNKWNTMKYCYQVGMIRVKLVSLKSRWAFGLVKPEAWSWILKLWRPEGRTSQRVCDIAWRFESQNQRALRFRCCLSANQTSHTCAISSSLVLILLSWWIRAKAGRYVTISRAADVYHFDSERFRVRVGRGCDLGHAVTGDIKKKSAKLNIRLRQKESSYLGQYSVYKSVKAP